MARTMNEIMHPGAAAARDPAFPYAPDGWTRQDVDDGAAAMGLTLSEDHLEAIRVIQGCYTDEEKPRIRVLHGALKARFRKQGGMKRVYELFPGGPIAQGCRLAGVSAPAGSVDGAEGSAQ